MVQPFLELEYVEGSSSRRQDVVRCAAALFLRDGIDSVRMTDVADAARLGVATLYRHFQTKTGLAIAAGTYLWSRFNDRMRDYLGRDEFTRARGGEQLNLLFLWYRETYLAHPDFVRFVEDFDHLVLSEKVEVQQLAAYGEAVDSFYPIFEGAYRRGLEDGSVTREVDFRVFYRTVAHALMGIAQKIAHGDVIPSDDFAHGADELDCVVRMARLTLGMEQ